MRKKYLAVLENKERNQERNIHGLVQYAKTLRGELEKYREDVEMSEKIVADL
jgi:chromosome segregation ATPase